MASNKNIELNWADLINISALSYHDRNEAGVYVWGFTINGAFFPYYIGIADNIIYRIHEHINSIISGRYTIFHKNSLHQFVQYKYQDVSPDKSRGKIYIPDWPYGFKTFLDNRKELQPHIDFMVDCFTFSYACINRELISRQDLKEIEKICINKLGKENLANTRSGHSEKFIIKHTGNSFLTNRMNTRINGN